ncbi:MAG: hypothetical protein ACKOB9_05715 [Solirubrobacterales bacterium]
MGMLDEAIREHFDLKRRNGADPAVIAVEEREALGDPAQREARAAEIAAERSQEIAEEEVEAVVVVAEEPGAVAVVEHEVLEAPDAVVEEETVVVAPEAVTEEEVVEEVEIPAEAPEQETQAFTVGESQEAVMPEPPARPVGAPPPAADAPGAPEGEQGEEARDELEETPEFLEETPEHDRLWFERKPPRDFDF